MTDGKCGTDEARGTGRGDPSTTLRVNGLGRLEPWAARYGHQCFVDGINRQLKAFEG